MEEQPAGTQNLRAKRSRKDRPCDHCRRSKRSCVIPVRGRACDHCARAGRECSFVAPPLNRHRKDGDESSEAGPSSPKRERFPHASHAGNGLGMGHVAPGQAAAHGLAHQHIGRTPRSSSHSHTHTPSAQPAPSHQIPSHLPLASAAWLAERSTAALPPRNPHPSPHSPLHGHDRPGSSGGGLLALLDSLEDDRHMSDHGHEGGTDIDLHYSSLDMDVTEEEESHYLGSGAVAQLTAGSLAAREHRTPDLAYRQVADPRYPAFFLKNPSKVYGVSNAAFVAEKAYQDVLRIVSVDDPGMPDRLIQHFLTRTLPALPILNSVRFEASLRGWQGAGPFPYAILCGVLSHSAIYEPSLVSQWKELWGITLHVNDNEYRSARLGTLQLALLDISGRPVLTPGGNHTGIARAVGALQLLGLHRDCSRWKLPRWERSLRKRIWWVIYVHDKWNSYTYGRPFNLDGTRAGIPPLTAEDDDWAGVPYDPSGRSASTAPQHSNGQGGGAIASFIALCRLSVILESLLPLLLDRDGPPRRFGLDRSLLRHAAHEVERAYAGLPADLMFDPANPAPAVRPGTRSLQLSHIGLTLLIARLGLEREDFLSLPHLVHGNAAALLLVEALAVFVENLTPEDHNSFWSPWCSHQLSNGVTLLLQQALRLHQYGAAASAVGTTATALGRDGRPLSTTLVTAEMEIARAAALSDIAALLSRLVGAVHAAVPSWEVAEAALPRISGLLRSMPPVPGLEAAGLVDSPPVPWPDAGVPDADIVALFDWLNGDIGAVF